MQVKHATPSSSPSPFRRRQTLDSDRPASQNLKHLERQLARRVKRTCRTTTLGDAQLKRVEDALLERLIDAHPNRQTALDRLVDDIARHDVLYIHPAPMPVPAPVPESFDNRERVEQLLVAAVVMGNHRNQTRALDRILGEIAAPPQAACFVADPEDYAAFVDNDFDGLS
jgi:hypothetical protein